MDFKDRQDVQKYDQAKDIMIYVSVGLTFTLVIAKVFGFEL